MKIVYSINEIREFYEEFQNRYPGRNEIWYRGESHTGYSLIPSLHRSLPRGCPHWLIVEKEKEALEIFKTSQPEIASSLTDWEILFYMQHYGVKTRFLDWSQSAKIALFFAFSGWDRSKGNCRLWLLDPCLLNMLSLGEREVKSPKVGRNFIDYLNPDNEVKNTVAIFPPSINPLFNERIKSQRGCFTMHYGNNTAYQFSNELMHEIDYMTKTQFNIFHTNLHDPNLIVNMILDNVELHSSMYDDVKEYLIKEGVTYKEIYPDIEGLAKYINDVMIKD